MCIILWPWVVAVVSASFTVTSENLAVTIEAQEIAAAQRYTGLALSASADVKRASASEVPASLVGDMPLPLKSTLKADLVWLVRCDSVPLAWRTSFNDSTATYSYHTIEIYLDHQSLSFIKAIIRSPEPCPLAPEDWYWGGRTMYILLESTLYTIAPTEPDSTAPLSKAILETQSADPSKACEIEAYSLSFMWKGGDRPEASPPDSTPCWGLVYKYYTPEFAVDSAHRAVPESGPPIKIISLAGSFIEGRPGWRVMKAWPPWMMVKGSSHGMAHPREF